MNLLRASVLFFVALAVFSWGCEPAVDDQGAGVQDPQESKRDLRLAALTEKLGSDDEEVAGAAFKETVLAGSSSIDGLAALLADSEGASEYLRSDAARGLGMIGDRRAIPALVKALHNDWSPGVRYCAAWALGAIGDPAAVPALEAALEEVAKAPNPWDSVIPRPQVLESLGAIGDASAVSALEKRLIKPDKSVDRDVAFALGWPRMPRALDILEKTFADTTLEGRHYLLAGVARFGGHPAIRVLAKALRDSDDYIRYRAADSIGCARSSDLTRPLLGPQRDPAAVPPLVGALKDAAENVRAEAARSLGVIAHVVALDGLASALTDKSEEVRKNAAEALGEIGGGRAATVLIGVLPDERSAYVRKAIVTALGETGDPRGVAALAPFIADKSASVREQIALALARFRDVRAVPSLRALLADKEADVRVAAVLALGEIGGVQSLAALRGVKDEPDEDVGKAIEAAIWLAQGPYTVQQLIAALKQKSDAIRMVAISLLLRRGTPDVIDALKEVVRSENRLSIRSAARNLLEELNPTDPWW